jgi:hypothetical protein
MPGFRRGLSLLTGMQPSLRQVRDNEPQFLSIGALDRIDIGQADLDLGPEPLTDVSQQALFIAFRVTRVSDNSKNDRSRIVLQDLSFLDVDHVFKKVI